MNLLDVNIRNLLSKYSKRDINNSNWLEAIKNLLTKNIHIKIVDEIKSNNIVDLINISKIMLIIILKILIMKKTKLIKLMN